MYPEDDLEGAEERLFDFLCFRLGGDMKYIRQRGHPRLRMRHAPYAINQAAADRWVQLMDNAFASTQLPEQPAAQLRQFLHDVAQFLKNQPD